MIIKSEELIEDLLNDKEYIEFVNKIKTNENVDVYELENHIAKHIELYVMFLKINLTIFNSKEFNEEEVFKEELDPLYDYEIMLDDLVNVMTSYYSDYETNKKILKIIYDNELCSNEQYPLIERIINRQPSDELEILFVNRKQ